MTLCYELAGYLGVLPNGLTLRDLWTMAQGRLKEQRRMLVAQASLVWCSAGPQAIEYFVRTGYLDASEAGEDVQEYSTDALKTIVESGLLRGVKHE